MIIIIYKRKIEIGHNHNSFFAVVEWTNFVNKKQTLRIVNVFEPN